MLEWKEISCTKVETLISYLIWAESATKSVSEDKQKIPHTVFGVVQSPIRTENL